MRRLSALVALAACLMLPAMARADLDEATALFEAGQYEEAFDAFAALAAEEDGEAMLWVGRMFESGQGVHQSRTKALTWYRRAAAHDNAEAAFRMGEMYEAGLGMPRNYTAAVNAFQTAANLGHAEALVRLANLYADGSGAMPDASHAARLLKQAADHGNREAQAALDGLVASGTVPRQVLDELGIPPPPPPALPTLEEVTAAELAEQGDALGDAVPEDETGAATASSSSSAEATVAITVPGPAIDESEAAATLRRAVLRALSGFGDADSHLDYTLDISEAGDGTLVSAIRGLRMVMDEGVWEIGDIVHTFVPQGGDAYAVTARVPDTTTIYDHNGMAVGGTTIGSQSFEGLYRLDLNLWPQAAGEAGDIAFSIDPSDDERTGIAIERIAYDSALTESAPGKWGGPTRAVVEGIGLSGDTGEIGRIERLTIAVEQRALDYVFFQALSLARTTIEQRFGMTPDFGDPQARTAMQELMRPVLALARERAPLMGDVGVSIELDGISGTDQDTGTPVEIDRVRFALGASGLDTASGAIAIAFEHEGLTMDMDGATGGYLPREASFVVTLDRLPVDDGSAMVLEMFEGGIDDPVSFRDNIGMALAFMGLGMQQSMAASGSTLEIERIAWVSDALKAEMTGSLVASASSPTGGTGTVTLVVEGLDEAVAQLSAARDDPDAQEMAMPLSMLQAMGQRTEEAGVVRHLYVLELTPDGRTLLNGNDMGPMMEGMMGGGTTMQ